jgi:hypothetical protein
MAKLVEIESLGGHPPAAARTEQADWLNGEALANMIIEKRTSRIKGVVGGPGTHMMASDPKAGKSRFGLECCYAVTTGTPLLGRFEVVAPAPALYWQADDTNLARFVANYQNLLHSMNGGRPLPNFEALTKRMTLIEDYGLQMLEDRIRVTGAGLAVVDCLQAVRGTRTRDFVGQEFGESRLLSEVGTRTGCSVLLLHHNASGRRASSVNPFLGAAGTFALNAGVDGLLSMGVYSTTRTERVVSVSGRDFDAGIFVYARDEEGRLFFVAGGSLAEVWEEALRLYRAIPGSTFGGKDVGEATGTSDRNGRAKLARLRAVGVVEDLSERRFTWLKSFTEMAQRVLKANAWMEANL